MRSKDTQTDSRETRPGVTGVLTHAHRSPGAVPLACYITLPLSECRGKTTRASPFYNLYSQKRQGCFVCTLGGDLCVIGNRRGGGGGEVGGGGGGRQVGRYLG